MAMLQEDASLDELAELGSSEAAARFEALATAYAEAHTPEQTLRFLFELDARLYAMQGRMAVAYGNGIHTKHRHIRYHDFFVDRVRAGETVLDIGCGNGALAFDLASRAGAIVTAIELHEANLRIARDRHAHPNVTYLCGDATRDLPLGHYDVVVLSNVLEHIDDRVGFLRGVDGAARPSRWLIRVPLFERDWRVPLKKELGLEWRLDATHCTEYTLESFAEEVHAAGLVIAHRECRWGEIWSELVQVQA
jgi:2-polyprenyl-3-methyl-5-hydroxy-6-metoxy-1,4-benzoquinol methylase